MNITQINLKSPMPISNSNNEEMRTREELARRINNGVMGLKYDRYGKKVLKIILNQAFIDGLLLTNYMVNNKVMLAGFVHDIKIDCKFIISKDNELKTKNDKNLICNEEDHF